MSDLSNSPDFPGPPGIGGVQKVTTFKWPTSPQCLSGNCGGLVAIGFDNAVHYLRFNGSSWGTWQPLGGYPTYDIAAVAYNNGEADIFRVDGDRCNIYKAHSANGQTWGSWEWWDSCGDQLDVALMPDGKGWAALRVLTVSNYVAMRYFNGSSWVGERIYPPATTQQAANDVSLLAYPNPVLGTIRMSLYAVAPNNNIYYRNSDGQNWSDWAFWTSGYGQVAAFPTKSIGTEIPDGGFLLFLGAANWTLYTQRFNSTTLWDPIIQQTVVPWLSVTGANFEDSGDPPYEHESYSDDCRVQDRTCYPDPNVPGYCFRAYTLNLAEILYNEARSETKGGQAMVGWTVRDRVFLEFNPPTCDYYPGQTGGTATPACIMALPCGDPGGDPPDSYCEISKKYCCALHGATTTWGTPESQQSQFNDEHVPFNILYNEGFAYQAVELLNGWIPDVSKGFIPGGIFGCNTHNPPVYPADCVDPFCYPCLQRFALE